VALFTCQALYDESFRTHGQFTHFDASPRGLRGERSALNELLPSNSHPSCRLVSIHICHRCNRLWVPLRCRAGGQMNGTPMWGRRLSACLLAVRLWMIDSDLKTVAQPFTFSTFIQSWTRTFSFFSLCLSPLRSIVSPCVCAWESRHVYCEQCAYDGDDDGKAND